MSSSPSTEANVLHELARLGETRTWEPGVVVVSEGEPGDCLYIVHEGVLRALVGGADGSRTMELNLLKAGEIFGELALHGERRSATVETVTRARLTRVTREHAEQLLRERPDLALNLIQRLIQRVRTLTRTVHDLGSLDVYQRLVGLCNAVAEPHEGRRCVRGLSQQRIAEQVGASRAMVNRLLQDLARGGYIEMQRGCIVLLRALPPRW